MSRDNVKQSLDAVEQALTHFAGSLDRAGFKHGVGAYEEMVKVVLGQCLWAQNEGTAEFEDQFRRLSQLALQIHAHLSPYAEVMEKLGALQGLVPENAPEVDADSVSCRILSALKEKRKPMSMTAIRSEVGISSVKLKKEIDDLIKRQLIVKGSDSGRSKYTLNSGAAAS